MSTQLDASLWVFTGAFALTSLQAGWRGDGHAGKNEAHLIGCQRALLCPWPNLITRFCTVRVDLGMLAPTQLDERSEDISRGWEVLLSLLLGSQPALPPQGDDKTFRRTPSWRKRFRPRDMHSINMLSGSAETLPAGFRVTSLVPLPPPSAPAKKMPPEGTSRLPSRVPAGPDSPMSLS